MRIFGALMGLGALSTAHAGCCPLATTNRVLLALGEKKPGRRTAPLDEAEESMLRLAADEYLIAYAQIVNERRGRSVVGIPNCTSRIRTHCCYVCGVCWTTAAAWPETRESKARGAAHWTGHAVEHAEDIAQYARGTKSLDRLLADARAASAYRKGHAAARRKAEEEVAGAEREVAAARRKAEEEVAAAKSGEARASRMFSSLIDKLRARGIDPALDKDALPEAAGDRFTLIELE